MLVEDCHKHIHGCCLQFSHTTREDVGGILLLKAGELCWFQGRVSFFHRKYSPVQTILKKINSTLAKTNTGAHERCPRAVSQGTQFCSSTMDAALDVWGQSMLPVPLPWSWAPVERCQCLAGAERSQQTLLYQLPLPGDSAGAAEL